MTILDAPAVAARFALAVTAPEQAEVLRLALDERDRTVQALQEAVHHLEQASIRRDEQHAAQSASTQLLEHQFKALGEEAARDAAERVTKGDLRELRTEVKNDVALVRQDINVLRTEFKSDIALVRKDMGVLRTELKSDLHELRIELKSDIALVRKDMDVLRTELKSDLRELRTEFKNDVAVLRKDMDGLRTELKSDLHELRTEFKNDVAVLRKDVDALENRLVVKLGGIVAVAIGAVVALLRLFPAG